MNRDCLEGGGLTWVVTLSPGIPATPSFPSGAVGPAGPGTPLGPGGPAGHLFSLAQS